MRCSVCWRSAASPLSSSDDLCSSTARSAASPYSPASASGRSEPVSLHAPCMLWGGQTVGEDRGRSNTVWLGLPQMHDLHMQDPSGDSLRFI